MDTRPHTSPVQSSQEVSPRFPAEKGALSAQPSLDFDDALHLCIEVFRLGDDRLGLTPLLQQLVIDARWLVQNYAQPNWVRQLSELLKEVAPTEDAISQINLEAERVRTFRGSLAKTLLSEPKGSHPPSVRLVYRQWRGLLCLTALAERRPISSTLATALRQAGGSKAPPLPAFHKEAIDAQLLQLDPDSPQARLWAYFRDGWGRELPSPFRSIVPRSQAPQTTDVALSPTTSLLPDSPATAVSPREFKERADLLSGYKAQVGLAGLRVFSGIGDLPLCLLPMELEAILPKILAWRSGAYRESYLCVLLTLLTRVMPGRYHDLPLQKTLSPAIWLDLEGGGFEWNLSQVITSHNGEEGYQPQPEDIYFHVPLPLCLIEDLRQLRQPEYQSVGDFFGDRIDDIARNTKRLLRELAGTSHRPTLTRLSHSWGRYLLHLCRDEAYASALSLDFTLGTTANFNYTRLQGKRVLHILQSVYDRLGLGSHARKGELPDVGSQRATRGEQHRALLLNCTQTIHTHYQQLSKRASYNELLGCHNQIALHTYALTKFVLGTRAQQEECLTAERVDLPHALMLVSDKRTSHYHLERLIGIPPWPLGYLVFYQQWLDALAYRLDRHNRRLAKAIRLSVVQASSSPLPWFFRLSYQGQPEALGSPDLAELFTRFGCANNAGRHTVDAVLREAGIDSASIMGWAGRGNPGQELFGPWSLAIPEPWAKTCAEQLNQWLIRQGLPSAPTLKGRQLTSTPNALQQTYCPERLAQLPPSLLTSEVTTPCPFPSTILSELRRDEVVRRQWQKAGAALHWGSIACALVIEDGVCLTEELSLILEAIDQEQIHHVGIHSFVDISMPSLGIRRVWLSRITRALLHQFMPRREALPTAQVLDSQIAACLPGCGISGMQALVAAALAYLTIHLPTLLSRWCCGEAIARTTRPQSVARHFINRCEPLQPSELKSKKRRTSTSLAVLLSSASRQIERGASDASMRSWLAGQTHALCNDLEPNSYEWVEAGYANHLCGRRIEISSIRKYLNDATPFLRPLTNHLFEQGINGIDWQKAFADVKDEAPLTAIRHFQRWLGITPESPRARPLGAQQYAETLSQEEGKAAFQYLVREAKATGDLYDRAATVLLLLLNCPMRWQEVMGLRVLDVCAEEKHPHVVVTAEAGTDLKSENANRVIPFSDPVLQKRLQALHTLQRQRHPSQQRVPLFGNPLDVQRNSADDRLHDLLSMALRLATGNSQIRIHALRHTAINWQLQVLLSPEKSWRDCLDQRQALFVLSAQAGHGTPETTCEHYAQGLDWARRKWLDRLQPQQTSNYGDAFLGVLTGATPAAIRQRRHRHGSVELPSQEGFQISGNDLAAGLQERPSALPPSELVADRNRRAAILVGLLILGDSLEIAALVAGVEQADAKSIQQGLRRHLDRYGISDPVMTGICREKFLEQMETIPFVESMANGAPTKAILRQLCARVLPAGNPWSFTFYEDLTELRDWISRWHELDINPIVLLKQEGQSQYRQQRNVMLRATGYQLIKELKPRHFSTGVQAYLKFGYRNPSQSAPLRGVQLLNFLLSVSVLSIYLQTT
ncbi:hypothetical protein OTERR_30530 [Oryzomicrobium terrae]|uniref:Tyr recombinase domain-containing protein n=1 Tax=Oryzomicrobium terrae TaxID=1735038 RepID=A0A5C1ED50_9RHOO|nr:site-specific integrase [Oryzomicrobium terrae]QEL66529.1 hypothetical protein OTERR_30530 [Oryzomicrobium terrae]